MNMNNTSIVPKPTKMVPGIGNTDVALIEKILVSTNDESEIKIARMIQKLLSPVKDLSIEMSQSKTPNSIFVVLNDESDLTNEGYSLAIGDGNTIEIRASSYSGLFYGYQSLRQLCGPELEIGNIPKTSFIPNVDILDAPTFGYRGMHLDVSRHFFDIDFIKTYIDMIALHKMNVFHWHLTDDNGWRIEIDRYPLLAERSAWRVDRTNEPWKEQSPVNGKEKATYGGYYTKEEIREVVEYAASNILWLYLKSRCLVTHQRFLQPIQSSRARGVSYS